LWERKEKGKKKARKEGRKEWRRDELQKPEGRPARITTGGRLGEPRRKQSMRPEGSLGDLGSGGYQRRKASGGCKESKGN
jgi:hypothetical protein